MLEYSISRVEAETVSIKNAEKLSKNASSEIDRKAREIALNALGVALEAVDPKIMLKSKVQMKGNDLKIGNLSFNLAEFKNIFVVGGGKASGYMAEALEELLGEYIKDGAVNVPYDCPPYQTRKIKLQRASHPIPDISGVKGTRRMLKLASQAKENELIICLLSGGGSSLMCKPCMDVSLRDKRKVTDALLKSGATINEINAVRKHISDFKGGWLARRAYPATVINLILSDVVGDTLDTIASGPTVPDPTTFQDAVEILKRYQLWNEAPTSLKKVLLKGKRGSIQETPKIGDKAFNKVHSVVVGNNFTSSLAACNNFRKNKLHALLLSSCLEGQAKDVGMIFASIAREIATSGNPVPKPAGIVVGGETTVTVVGKGKGGRRPGSSLGGCVEN